MVSQDELQGLIKRTITRLPSSHDQYEIDVDAIALADTIDHTLLKLDATEAQIDKLCEEAKAHEFRTVCVRLPWVERCALNLKGYSPQPRVCCVIGFHEGTHTTQEKKVEAGKAVEAGALELDMVINWPLLKKGNYLDVYEDIRVVRSAAHGRVRLKVILETSQLSHEEIIAACVISAIADANYVKTSSGFCGQGATAENVRLMYSVSQQFEHLQVKASGGVRTHKDWCAMMAAGASRIGTSNGVTIMEDAKTAVDQPKD